VRLENFIELIRLADKKRQETKQTYCIDKNKINDDIITTERPAGNTRLWDNSLICSTLKVGLPHSFHRSVTANTPANRLLPIASVVRGNPGYKKLIELRS